MKEENKGAGPMDLDDLLTSAMANRTPPKSRKGALDKLTLGQISAADKRIKEIFTNPENWQHTRFVTLVHQSTEMLLGNFEELRHKTAKDCRKLVRVEGPQPVDAIEYVDGSYWIAPELRKTEHERQIEEREVVMDVHLKEINNAFASGVILTVRLEFGGIARAELFDDVTFRSKDGRTFLELPGGTDILEGMSLECRIQLRKEVGL